MRNLIHILSDGKKYTFRTLTRKQAGAFQKKQANSPYAKEIRELDQIEDEEGLTVKQQTRSLELSELEEINVYEMLRLSMTPAHPEFALTKDKKKEAELNDRIQDLMDIRDMGIVSNFAITGTLLAEDKQTLSTADIDLTT